MATDDQPSADASNYFRVEVSGFGVDPDGVPLTSYLRLGAIGDVPNQLPGLAIDPGRDLARYVTMFADDDRARCDPPELDETVAADGAPRGAPTDAALSALKVELDAATKLAAEIDATVEAVAPDPEAWLDAFVVMREEAIAAVDDRKAELEAALARASAAKKPELDDLIPPHYSAPGKRAKSDEADESAVGDRARASSSDPETPFARYRHKVARKHRTKELHRVGGWRDHTDGNRISTTRGDKLEVVGGHYRLVVLGRTDEPTDADGNPVLPGWDISGGHVHLKAATRVVPQHAIGWTQRWNGTWHSFEETLKGDTATLLVGDHEDEHHGHFTRSTIGSETPDAWHEPIDCPGGFCRTNPRIRDRSWAEEMLHYTGSEKRPIPTMVDKTWASVHEGAVHAGSHSDLRQGGSIATETHATSSTMRTHAGSMSTTTTAGRIVDRTVVGSRVGTTIATLICNANIGSMKTTTIGGHADAFIGARTTVNLAGSMNVTAGAIANVTVGVEAHLTAAASMSVSMQGQKNVRAGTHNELNLGPSIEVMLMLKMIGAHIEIG